MANYLGIPSGGTEETEMDLMINAASQWALEYTDRSTIVRNTSLTEYYDGDNTRTLLARSKPINSVVSIHIDTAWAYGSDTLVSASNYTVYTSYGMIKTISDVFIRWPNSVKLVYDVGYATIPYNIQSAVKELVRFWYERGTGARVGVRSVNVGDKNITYETDIPESVKKVIGRYKLWRGIVR